MIHRLAVILGSVAAAAILAIGFAATGLGPAAAPAIAEQSAPGSVAAAAALTVPAASVKPITRVETKTIYVRPAAKPKVIHVTKHVAPAPSKRQQPKVKVVHVTKVVPSKHRDDDEHDDDGGEHDDDGGEHEGGDD